ncbi:LytTR family transcriptional regulator [Chromobacterium sp. F49]|uniref:LytR/AlgR family response regulator transcription factor n=4 Tax=Chromobacteriaceae TaxID=1499392 RepID=UPI0005BB326B|nr:MULTISPECIES: LytTR family DNA-binding domain-containing protein [Chromobacterium]KZE84602.1 LytTR family transcriptional regulator [Chromobacterium sp. F49]OBU87548.1 LytTR family transcriptional regulator [Chromobacterium subtsugae]WSE90388.1 LytTR family DNA-binding domain-containing protein [Chromobacterium subtsugae]WVH58760.1 LytTR family DNA-binding domain-containing protein [Chromobacterium subtsugae]
MLKALIVEDEYLARQELAYLIREHSGIEILASVEDGLEAFKFLQENEVDVVFLDIHIPSIDGLLLAKNLHKTTRPPRIVFVTAYKEFAVEAFEVEAFDYILKPYNEQRIAHVLHKLEALEPAPPPAAAASAPAADAAPASRTVNLAKGDSIIVTPCDDIYYVEADEKVTLVYTARDRYVMAMSISEFVSRLPADSFFRCHRSFCVNIHKIREIAPWQNSTYIIKLYDLKAEIPVSRSNIKAFRQLMHL